MDLKKYLEEEAKMTAGAWAKKHKYNPASVWAWATGRRMPNLANLRKLMKDTNGMVGPGDFA